MIKGIRRTLIAAVLIGAAAGCAGRVDLEPVPTFRESTVPVGTVLTLRLDTSLASDTSRVDDAVQATLMEAVVVDGVDVLPRGSVLAGAVTAVESSGKVSGVARLVVQFRSVSLAGRAGEIYALSAYLRTAAAPTRSALIGGAGTAVVLATSVPQVRWASGLALSIPIDDDIDVKIPLKR